MNNTTHRLTSRFRFVFFGLILSIAVNLTAPLTARANPSVLYAAPDEIGSGDCTSWANACTLQTAFTTAVSGDEIWVHAGAHYPGSAGARLATFTLKSGVALYGGFAGGETSLDERDWQTNPTILSGDIDNNDTNDDGNDIAETADDIQGDNAYHVVTGGGTDSTAVLDGFIITAGQANDSFWPRDIGGGMYNNSSSPTLANVTFSGNSSYSGGGIYNYDNCNPTLTDVTFSGNSATYGGGIYNYDNSNPLLTDVTFSSNTATNYGGGMYNWESNPTLTNVTFSSNNATRGGGMYNWESNPTLTDVTLSDNSAFSGGGMANESSSPTLTCVTFSENSASDHGGGMFNWDSSSPTLTNVTFNGNAAPYGGGMANWESTPTLTNVTFSGNTASYGGGMRNYSSSPRLINVTFSGSVANYGGGMYNVISNPTLTNIIMWGDSASTGSEINNDNDSTPTIAYSDIQGCGSSSSWNSACGTDDGGNIDADPFFVDAAAGNMRLQLTSPAVDAGNNAALPSGIITDLDGNPRFVDILTIPDTGNGTPPIVDMGAYEVQNNIFLPLILK